MKMTKTKEEFHKRKGGWRYDQFSVTGVNAGLEEKLIIIEYFHSEAMDERTSRPYITVNYCKIIKKL